MKSLILKIAIFLSVLTLASSATADSLPRQFTDPTNYGYDNPYLDKYLKGKVSAPPPFGGAIQSIVYCQNYGVRWMYIGPPRPGTYIWDPSLTRTFEFGPPSHTGQYAIGLYAPKYFCIFPVSYLKPEPGIIMTMVGTSQ